MAKYIQREETRYKGNEFESMPSIDFGGMAHRLYRSNKARVDWDKVKEICNKHGFQCCTINSTFGGDDMTFVVYEKTTIDNDYYEGLRKSQNYDQMREIYKGFVDNFKRLHECVHELDEETDLQFDCSWGGNCGLFGSDDVHAKVYVHGSHLTSWKEIENIWSPLIHDTKQKLTKGIYVMMSTYHIKPQIVNSPEFEVMLPKLMQMVRDELAKGYTAEIENGKRGCDNANYDAVIIRDENGSYCSMINFSRNRVGEYNIYRAQPLCGECSWTMDWENPQMDIRSALPSYARK